MNELIQNFSDQADRYSRSDNSSMAFEGWKKRYTEKLVELCIKECADVLEAKAKQQKAVKIYTTDYSESQESLAAYLTGVRDYGSFLLAKNANLLKNHFGIENE